MYICVHKCVFNPPYIGAYTCGGNTTPLCTHIQQLRECVQHKHVQYVSPHTHPPTHTYILGCAVVLYSATSVAILSPPYQHTNSHKHTQSPLSFILTNRLMQTLPHDLRIFFLQPCTLQHDNRSSIGRGKLEIPRTHASKKNFQNKFL